MDNATLAEWRQAFAVTLDAKLTDNETRCRVEARNSRVEAFAVRPNCLRAMATSRY